MRNPKGKKNETIEVLSDGDVQEHKLPIVTNEHDVVADATLRNPEPPAEAPVVRRFAVVGKSYFTTPEGVRVELHEGKVVDTLNYDIPRLRKSGVRLQEVTETDDAQAWG